MNKFSILAIGLAVGFSAQAQAAGQSNRENDRSRGDQVCVYKDINYLGAEQCYKAGAELKELGAQSKSISSMRVYGRATVTVFENTNFRGNSTEFTSDVSDLGQRMMPGRTAWSDHIDSLRIGVSSVGDRRNPGDSRRDQPREPRDGICVYERPNYEGRSECWNQGQNIADLTREGNWSDRISSIRLFGRASVVVYQDIGYRGERLTVDSDIPDLKAVGERGRTNNGNGRGRGNGRNSEDWDHAISSVQVQSKRR